MSPLLASAMVAVSRTADNRREYSPSLSHPYLLVPFSFVTTGDFCLPIYPRDTDLSNINLIGLLTFLPLLLFVYSLAFTSGDADDRSLARRHCRVVVRTRDL
jgi:hypothetical protein